MKMIELLELLEIPNEVKLELSSYDKANSKMTDSIAYKLLQRNLWDEGIKELQEILGEDPNGIKILWELLNIVADYSYKEYTKRDISENFFVATMKFCTRFLNEYYQTYNSYKFVWAWWFPRQISLKEFRIGALEYEFVDSEEKEIAVHIPSDANLHKESVLQSLNDFFEFRKLYYPEWENVKLTCDSWMLMPELKELLGKDSNIVAFQNLFEIDSIDNDATWYMGWIFPGYEEINESLPEQTRLQRRMKEHLLAGKRFGIAKGHLRNL